MKNEGQLNNAQQQAVAIDKGPALVVAGAGTGKTKVIVERIYRLLQSGTPASRILALTFTEKAAAEMTDRVNELTGGFQLDLPIMTFNAYGESLLRRYSADIGLNRNFTLLGDSAQIIFLRERIDELGLDYYAPVTRPDGLLGDIRDYFSLLKQHVITPDAYRQHIESLKPTDEAGQLEKKRHKELAQAYERYITLCRQAGVVDYDDHLYVVLDLFRQRPNILEEVQAAYDFVMVDEFQDTNTMQSDLVDSIAGKHQNLFVVGDDDQSIYGWRGATLANILRFKERYPKAKEILLTQNYRSTQAILDRAYELIQHNNPYRLESQLGISKQLQAHNNGPTPIHHQFETAEAEMQWVVDDIQQRLEQGTPPGFIAILSRRNTTVRLLHGYLEQAGVEHVVSGLRYELYQQPIVRMLLEVIKAIVEPDDSLSLYHTLTGPLCGLPAETISQLAGQARRSHQSLWELWKAQDRTDKASQKAYDLITTWREQASTLTVGQLAYEILESSGYKNDLYRRANEDATAALAVSRLSELFMTFKQFEQIALQPSARQYVEALPALQAAGDSNEDGTMDLSGQSVNVLTIHKAKGLEWPIVYIVDCIEGSFPLRQGYAGIRPPQDLLQQHTSEADAHMPEERRLMYVAMTRAKAELIFTSAERQSTNGSVRKVSRFLAEANIDPDPKPLSTAGSVLVGSLNRFAPLIEVKVPIPSSILDGERVTLTVSQVQRYLECPLDFYYCHVLNVPQESSPLLEYGSLMHSLVEDLNKSLMAGKTVSLVSLEKRLDQEWPALGYLSKGHRDRSRQLAVTSLKNLYDRITTAGRQPLAVEEPFSFSLPECQLKVSGRFDAVFPLRDGIEIVDYKTSVSVDTPEKAKQRATSSQQLTLYALAWQMKHDELPVQVTLDFIDTGMTGSVKKTLRGIEGAKTRLTQVADGIRGNLFAPGNSHLFCIHPPL